MDKRKQIVKSIILLTIIAGIISLAYFAINYLDTRKTGAPTERQSAVPDPEYLYLGDKEYEITHNIKTYLIVGTDGNGTKPNAKDYHGPMADYQLLLLIDKTDGKYGFIQIDRDSITDVELINSDGVEETADTEELQICTATWYGKDLEQGLDNLVNSASYLLGGIRIDGYYSLNMREIGKLNHAVGGVTVKIEDDFSKYDKEMVPGATVTLTDEQAALFVRSRMSIGDGSNESRMRRQRVYMEALMDKVRKQMTEDKSFGIDIYNELQDIAVTNIPKNRISAISNLMYKSTGKGIRDIDGEHTMGRLAGDKKDFVQFYADEESMVEIFADLIGIGEGKEY